MSEREQGQQEHPSGEGPLAGSEPATGRPIEDPAMADRANPRWDDPSSGEPDAFPGDEADGVARAPGDPTSGPMTAADDASAGTPEDQAARPIEPDVGRDNLREGKGGGTANPALAEGGEGG